jgi:uncharacterized protein (DUF2252 family)
MTSDGTPAERKEQGKALRKRVPRSSHAEWAPAGDRSDPVELLSAQDAERLQWLVPIRHGRMAVSAFTFYRGAAKIMAADLAETPKTGQFAQICGDAHLSNFGSFASPERAQLFDINDFDETLPGPWEWDLKRMATSFVLAGRDNKFDKEHTRSITTKSVEAYRQGMAKFAAARTMDVWYAHLTLEQLADALPKKKDRARLTKGAAKARSKDHLKAMSKLTHQVDGKLRIKSDAPLLIPLRDIPTFGDPDQLRTQVEQSLAQYRETLSDNRRRLLDRFHVVDIALKVVGVGSVGTRCMIVLLVGNNAGDPLLLQIKEATDSVLADQLPKSVYPYHGQRVVEGQRLMQGAGDIFLGWSQADSGHQYSGHQYYWRQFHDMKGSADVAAMSPRRMAGYAKLCGWTLAHAHARSGDPIAISGYLGRSDVFDRALTEFAFRYADQNQHDYEAFTDAIASGRIEAKDD